MRRLHGDLLFLGASVRTGCLHFVPELFRLVAWISSGNG